MVSTSACSEAVKDASSLSNNISPALAVCIAVIIILSLTIIAIVVKSIVHKKRKRNQTPAREQLAKDAAPHTRPMPSPPTRSRKYANEPVEMELEDNYETPIDNEPMIDYESICAP
ncbi:uncharacterized protein [Watersipora subatra]|uniref:uncharacterized protein n=1 Tax=Watersipora subatra TaxID=2589382 RepID=UPI00355BCD80